jgi:hypothetical protein
MANTTVKDFVNQIESLLSNILEAHDYAIEKMQDELDEKTDLLEKIQEELDQKTDLLDKYVSENENDDV